MQVGKLIFGEKLISLESHYFIIYKSLFTIFIIIIYFNFLLHKIFTNYYQ